MVRPAKPRFPNPQGDMTFDVVCIDLDGTLAADAWPNPWIGEVLPEAEDMLRFYHFTRFAITIYTARPWSHEATIWAWLKKNGLDQYVYNVVCGKPPAALYIDDKSWNPTKGRP